MSTTSCVCAMLQNCILFVFYLITLAVRCSTMCCVCALVYASSSGCVVVVECLTLRIVCEQSKYIHRTTFTYQPAHCCVHWTASVCREVCRVIFLYGLVVHFFGWWHMAHRCSRYPNIHFTIRVRRIHRVHAHQAHHFFVCGRRC